MKKTFKSFSKKQLEVLCWWSDNSRHKNRDAIICDGAVRSGKTICMSLSFIFWAFHQFEDESFALCGKTVTSLKRNVVTPLMGLLKELGYTCRLKVSSNLLEISKGSKTNRFYLFGGKDEGSAALIQGVTLCGVMLDECALMPRSFVEQALARCSVTGSKFWFNCNPEHPHHWFYSEWILKAKEKNALYLHFEMSDNPSLSPEMLRRYSSLYSGAFYERFVKGKWVAAQGLVYPHFSCERNVYDEQPSSFEEYWISCDYGTVNPASLGLWGKRKDCYWRISEYYFDSRQEGMQKTDEEYYEALCCLAGSRKIECIVVDPSAASFIACIRRHREFSVIPAKNDVMAGIRQTSEMLRSGKLLIHSSCTDSIREFSLYRFAYNSKEDSVRKEFDHAMDDIRYFVSTVVFNHHSDDFTVITSKRPKK